MNSSFDPKAMEAWFTLMSQAMRGASQAQDAWSRWAALSGAPDDLQGWMKTYMPDAAASPEQFEAWMREWQRMAGVVPRRDYLEALARNAELERKLKSAEATIDSLRKLLSAQENQAEGLKQATDTWTKLMDETLKAQNQWLQAWTGQAEEDAQKRQNEEDE
ncbi:MAG: hypothetical protein H6642_09245 [Caldilineaceae bacterium]|nr:hypothetical protein [Caldilineaceae bacterium]